MFDVKEMLMLFSDTPEPKQSQNVVINVTDRFAYYNSTGDRYVKITVGHSIAYHMLTALKILKLIFCAL